MKYLLPAFLLLLLQQTATAQCTAPGISASSTPWVCDGQTITLMFIPQNGYTYKWSPGGQTTTSIIVTTSGSYSVTATNGSGCSATSGAVTVRVDPIPPKPVITASGSTTICPETLITLSVPEMDKFSWQWSNGAKTPSIVVGQVGSYSVITKSERGCTSPASDPVAVTLKPAAKPVIAASGPTTFCGDGSVTLSASAANSYLWSNGAVTQSITATATGHHSVTAFYANGCGRNSDPVYVLSDRVPDPEIIASGPRTFCEGSVTLSAPTSPVWNPKSQYFSGKTMAAGFSVAGRGFIVGGLQKFDNGFEYEATDVYQYNAAENTWTAMGDFPIKRAAAVGFSIGNKGYVGTGITNNQVVKDFWEYNPANNTWTQKADFGGTARREAVGFGIGSKGFIGTGSDASGTRVKDFWEYDPAANAWTKKADVGGAGRSGAVGFNIGGMGYIGTGLTANGAVKDFWQYNPTSGAWAQKADFGGAARSGATGFGIGTKGYIGIGSNGANYVKDFWRYDPAANVWLQRKDFSGAGRDYAVSFVMGNQAYVSKGRTTNNEFLKDLWELNGNDDYTYAWNPGNLTTSSITAAASGSYTVALTSAQGCSATSNPVQVTVGKPTAKPVVTTSGPAAICKGSSVTLSAPGGFASYLWSPGGQTTSSITVTDIGSYTVIVASAGACKSAPSDPITVSLKAVPAKPVVTAGGPTHFCAGGSVTLSTPAGLSAYQWNPGGQTTPSITATQSGNYTVTVTNEVGCSATSDAVVVAAETAPKPAIAANGPTKLCGGGSVTLSVPTGYASYKWSPGGQTNAYINVTQAGSYSVTVTTARGCISTSDSIVIQSETIPKPVVITSGLTTFCAGGDVTLSAAAAGDTWTHKADLIAGIDDDLVVFSIGNKGYISTGSGSGAGGGWGNQELWEYDPLANVWTQKADFGGRGRVDAAGFSIGNKGYVGTGWPVGNAYEKDFWEYDPVANVWTRKADFGGVGRKYAIGFSVGSKGYLGLGYDRYGPLRDFWEYNPLTDTWKQIADFGGEGREQSVAFSIGNKGYVGTGLGYYFDVFSDFWEYDPAINAWTRKADFGGGPRYNSGGFSIGAKGYIGAGDNDVSSQINDFWEYNPTINAWTRKADIKGAKNYAAMAFSISGNGYFFYQNQATDNFWKYDPGFNYTWLPGGQTTPSIVANTAGSYSLVATSSTGSGCSATANPVVVSITAPTGLALNGYKDTINFTYSTGATLAVNCLAISQVTTNGSSPVSGNVVASITVANAEPSDGSRLYIRRYTQITPAANAATATARVTLYALQSEFDLFNNASNTSLPTGPGDAAGISRLRIYKYNGTSSNGSGLPATYSGTPTVIDPADADIVWNSTGRFWQISFDITGFSGFFIGAQDIVLLPLQLTNFTARKQGGGSLLTWQVAQETNIATYTVERSADGRGYKAAGSLSSPGNTAATSSYSFADATPLKGANYYRLKITEKDGKISYSEVRVLNWGNSFTIALYPNPAKDKATLTGVEAGMHIRLLDAVGKVLRQQKVIGTTEDMVLSGLAQGLYLVQIHGTDGKLLSTVRLVKE